MVKVPPMPVNVPVFALVTVQVLATLSPVRVFVPAPPSMEPVKVPPFRMKLSVDEPPVRLAKLLKLVVTVPSYKVPLFVPVTVQVLAVFSPVKVLVPLPSVMLVMLLNVPPIGLVAPAVVPLTPLAL